ncbi:MAG: discoidin domain-containing protein [Verrucomicrobiota bacterium]
MRNAVLIWMLLASLSFPTARGEVWSWFNHELATLETESVTIAKRASVLPPIPSPQIHDRAGFHSGFAPDADTSRWVQVDLGRECELDAVVVVPAFAGTQRHATGVYGFPPRFRLDASNDPGLAEPIRLLDHTDQDCLPLMAPIHIAAHRVKARYVRFTVTRLQEDPDVAPRSFFCLGELFVFSDGTNVATRCPVTALNAVETLPTWSPRNLVDGFCALGLPVLPQAERTYGWRSDVAQTAEATKWVQVDLGTSHPLQEVRLVPAHPPGFPERTAFGFPSRFKVETDEDANFSTPRIVFESTADDFPNPGDNPVTFSTGGVTARFVRVTATRLWERTGDFVFALGELEVYADGKNVARSQPVSSLDDAQPPATAWHRQSLTDGLVSEGALMDWSEWLRQLSERRELRERFQTLEKLKIKALAVAQSRALWSGVAAASVLVLLAGAAVWRTRARQQRELQALRERIARDLHDDLGSHLGSIRMMSELALRHPTAPRDDAPLQEIHRLSAEAAESMHTIVWLMRESGAPPLARLIEAIQQSAETLLPEVQREILNTADDASRPASLSFHRHIILFVREGLHNIARHAGTQSMRIHTGWDAHSFRLTIEDNGCGFDPEAAHDGNGLANLRHRATVLGGHVTIHSSPGHGTHIHLEAPIA